MMNPIGGIQKADVLNAAMELALLRSLTPAGLKDTEPHTGIATSNRVCPPYPCFCGDFR